MADNFNINTTQDQSNLAAGVGNDGSLLGDNIYGNMLKSQNMEQLVQQAKERTQQAKLSTQQQQEETDTKGFLSEKGQVQKPQAISELKTMLKKEKWDDQDITDAVNEAEASWPDVLNASDIRGFISALRKEKSTTLGGTPFQAKATDASKEDEHGEPLVEGQYYTAKVNEDGDTTYIRSGEPAAEVRADAAGNKPPDDKEWIKLGHEITGAVKSRFGVVGQLGTTITRSLRALNTLAHGDLTKQDVENISTDIAAIYQGGVPSITQIVENSYGTTLQNLAETLRHYTGILGFMGNKQVLHDTKIKLTQVLNDMRNSAVAQIQEFVEMQFPFYKNLIESDPSRWEQAKQGVLNFITAGEVNEKGEVLEPSGAPKMAAPGEKQEGQKTAAPASGGQNDPLGIR